MQIFGKERDLLTPSCNDAISKKENVSLQEWNKESDIRHMII